MKRKLGAITIGQSPRNDVIPEMEKYLGEDIEIIQAGALDGLTVDEIKDFQPEKDDYVLVSKLRDGSSVKFAERYILPRLQDCIDKLEKEGADIILFICTGVFPDIFKSKIPIIYPEKILHSLVPSLLDKGNLAVVTPDKLQVNQSKEKWKETREEVKVLAASPYSKNDEFSEIIEEFKKDKTDIIVLDCMGYTQEMKDRISEATGKIVILSRTIVARVLGEILN